MAKIANKNKETFIDLKINGFDVEAEMLESIRIVEEMHNVLPYCEIKLHTNQKDVFGKLLKIGSKIEFKWKHINKSDKYDFYQTDVKLHQYGRKYILTIKGVTYVPNYFQNSLGKQQFFKNKPTKKVFPSVSSVKVKMQIQGSTNDIQTWIRPGNYTDKNFIDYLYNYCFKDDDLILCAVNFKGELIIDNFNHIKGKGPKLISNNEGDILFNGYDLERRVSVFDYKLSPLRTVRTFDVPIHKISEYSIPNVSMFTKQGYNEIKKYFPFKVLLNNMNTYPKYLYAYRYNNVLRKRLHFFELRLSLNTIGFPDLNLMDLIKFKEYDAENKKPVPETSGKYMLTKRELIFDTSGLKSYFVTISRDFYN